MSSDKFEKLEVLYGQIYELSIIVGQLIDRKQFASLDSYIDLKEKFFEDAAALLKEIGEDADMSRYYEICEKIQTQESANISLLTSMRDEIKKELQKTNKKNKLVNAYSNVETKQGNLLDMRE